MPYTDPDKQREWQRQWTAKKRRAAGRPTKQVELAKRDMAKKERLAVKRQMIADAKKQCCKCGETHPATLEFHHRNNSGKSPRKKRILSLASGFSIKSIAAELAVCEVLCANCHCKAHWSEKSGPWYPRH